MNIKSIFLLFLLYEGIFDFLIKSNIMETILFFVFLMNELAASIHHLVCQHKCVCPPNIFST